MNTKIPVGISACLLGEKVRYDGGHKQSRFCLNHLSEVFQFQSFCPEMAIGLGVPREPIRMVGTVDHPRVVGTKSLDLDVTGDLYRYGKEIANSTKGLCGYILMSGSPSCGLYSTKVYKGNHNLPGKHAGMFARALRDTNPLLPLEEEGRLNDPVLRENFIARVFAFADWKACVEKALTPKSLIDFHSRYKYRIMAHGQQPYKALGQLVSGVTKSDVQVRAQQYLNVFLSEIARPASRKGHANALYHLLGYLRGRVSGVVRQKLVNDIEDYRKGIVNLSVPVALLSHYVKLEGDEYVNKQAYWQPYERGLGLMNAI